MAKFIGIVRVSHDKQKQSGLGEAAQHDTIGRWVEFQRSTPKYGGHETGQILVEPEAVSARKVPLLRRPIGQTLLTIANPGDVIVFAVLDRAFRSILDAEHTREWCDKHGITMHFCNLNIDLSTKEGRFMFRLMVSAAQLESDAISDRVKAAQAAKTARDGKVARRGSTKIGYKRIKVSLNGKRYKREILNDKAVPVIQMIRRLRDEEGLSYYLIGDRIEEHFARLENRPVRPRESVHFDRRVPKREWTMPTVRKAYLRSASLLDLVKLRDEQRLATARAEKARNAGGDG